MSASLAGSKVLITGASSGIGRETALTLARAGATVGIVGRRAEMLRRVLEECRSHIPDCAMWAVDLGNLAATERLADEAWQVLDGVDILINNAAVPKVKPVTRLTAEMVEDVMAVNFFSPVRLTLRLLPAMLERGSGTIVNVASVGGRMGIAHEAAYCASKFALTGWSEALAIDLHDSGVAVRLVQPGPIATDIWDRPGEERAVYDGPLEPPSVVAEGIAKAITGDGFEHYFPDMKGIVSWKDSAIDDYIAAVGSSIRPANEEGSG